MKLKPLVYLETSYWRRLLDHHDPERRRATYAFLKKVARRSRLRISRMVLAELVAVRDLSLRRQLLRKVHRERVRSITAGSRVDRRVEELEDAGWLGQGQLADLYHIALCYSGWLRLLGELGRDAPGPAVDSAVGGRVLPAERIEEAEDRDADRGGGAMARHKDPVMADVLRIRRRISRRLVKARRAGRLTEEREAIEREAEAASRKALDGSSNGRSKRRE